MIKRLSALLLIAGLASISAAQLQAGSPWPKVHGNLFNTGVGLGSGNIGMLEWKFGTANDHFSAPVIAADGTLYMGDAVSNGTYYLLAADSATGTYKWGLSVGGQIEGSPAIGSDGTIYVGSDDDNLYAVNPDGSLKWIFHTGGYINGSPTVGPDGTIYVGSNDLNVHAVTDGGTQGINKWSTLVESDVVSNPVINTNGEIVVGTKGYSILALNPATGNIDNAFSTDLPITTDPLMIMSDLGIINSPDKSYDFYIGQNANASTILSTANTYYSPANGPDGTLWMPTNVGVTAYQDEATPYQGLNTYTYGASSPSSIVIGSDGTAYVAADKLYSLTPNYGQSSPTLNWAYPVQANAQMAMDASGTIYLPDSVNGGMLAIGNNYILSATMDDSAIGGQYVNGTIKLAAGAITANDSVSLSSSSPDVQIPGSLPAPMGGYVNFSLATFVVGAPETVTITATCQSTTKQMMVTLNPAPLDSISLTNSSLMGGTTAKASVTLDGPTGPNGDAVSITSSSADAIIPATVTVPNGSQTISFTFPTSAVSSTEQITLTATLGPWSAQTTLTLNPAAIAYLELSPTSVQGGQRTALGVYLSGKAGSAGDVVTLSSSSADAVVQSTLTITAGATSGSVFVHTLPVNAKELVTLTATFGSSSWQSTLALLPATLTSVKAAPNSFTGGNSGAFAVYFNGEAGSGGAAVTLSSSSTDVTIPGSVTVQSGASSANVAFQVAAVSSPEQVILSATSGSTTLNTTITLNPAALSGLQLQAPTVVGGAPTSLAIYLNARSAGASITLSSSSSSATLQSSVTIPAGAGSASVVVHTAAVDSQTAVTLSATLGGHTVSTTLTINPAALSAVKLQPTSVVGGNPAKFAVYLNGPAGPSGTTVNFGYTNTVSTMPTSVTIPAGATSANVTITTVAVSSPRQVGVFASLGSNTLAALLTVNPH